MKLFILLIFGLVSLSSYAEITDYENFSQTVSEFKHEIQTNQELRKLLRRSRKSENHFEQAELKLYFEEFFNVRGIKFGYVEATPFASYDFLFYRFAGNRSGGMQHAGPLTYGMGLGFGYARGYQVAACIKKPDRPVYGVSGTLVAGAGIAIGIYAAFDSLCVRLASAVGLDAGAGVDRLEFFRP